MDLGTPAISKDFLTLAQDIKNWGQELGFQQVGICNPDLSQYTDNLYEWLAKGYHGTMHYMEKNTEKRIDPTKLIPNTLSIIMVRMDYLPPNADIIPVLRNPKVGAISRYALGKDYHKLIRKRLEKLAKKITAQIGPFQYRSFSDSAPVMEKPLAEKAGLGWTGKHTILLNRHAGSWFFLGALLTDLPLPIDAPVSNHCGSCTACINICPTGAIIGPKQLDARKCISYLTIESKDPIPIELRSKMGNRIYGCDDCQWVCPWNRYAKTTQEPGFYAKEELKAPQLVELFAWTEEEFLKKTEGSAIRRIGFEAWQRNIAVALGNAPFDPQIIEALSAKLAQASDLVREHIVWALARFS
jgi:epoxyqueuosine reductase